MTEHRIGSSEIEQDINHGHLMEARLFRISQRTSPYWPAPVYWLLFPSTTTPSWRSTWVPRHLTAARGCSALGVLGADSAPASSTPCATTRARQWRWSKWAATFLVVIPTKAGTKELVRTVYQWWHVVGVALGSLSKPGRRRQREEPGKDCFRISDVFATLLILILPHISSVSAKDFLLRPL